jgi:cyclase
MRHSINVVLLGCLFLVAATISAQDTTVFRITQLTENIYRLTTDEGSYTTNVLVFVGEDGLLLVDTNTEDNADELKEVVESFGKGLPRYIINTHRHVEHVGGNAIFGPSPVIIAHSLLPQKLRSGSYLFDEFPDESLPDITFTDSLTLFFNGERIRLIALAGSHDDNEIIVHFTNSGVVHLSSLINGMNFPSVDRDGNALLFDSLVSLAIDLLPEDVTVVSGHNDLATWQDLHTYRKMIRETTAIVRAGLDAGDDIAALQEKKVLADYEAFNNSYVSTDKWIEYLATAINNEKHPSVKKKKIYEPLYYALKEGGVGNAIDKYFEIKNDHIGEYDIDETDLLVIGDKLVHKNTAMEAIEILKLYLKEYPQATYTYYAHYDISTAYRDIGDKDRAVKHCMKALELQQDFEPAAILLEELKAM